MYDGSHEDVHTSCKVSLVETMEFATPVESADNRRTNRPERERERKRKYACVQGRMRAKFQICKNSEHLGENVHFTILKLRQIMKFIKYELTCLLFSTLYRVILLSLFSSKKCQADQIDGIDNVKRALPAFLFLCHGL